jgi:hypothetical protein
MDDGPFLWLSQASVIRARRAAGDNGVAVLVALAAVAPVDGSDFKASVQNIAAGSGLSVRSVQRLLPVLAQARVVAIQSGKGKGPGGVDTASTFRLLRVNLSFAEGGGIQAPTAAGGHPRASRVRGRVQTQSTSLAEDRDISAERQRDGSTPTATATPACAAGSPGRGAKGEGLEIERPKPEDSNAW